MSKSKYTVGNYELRVGRSKTGLGLFTLEEIPKKACLMEYKGRLISNEEQYTSRSKYLFTAGRNKVIDGNIPGNTARYINHSCAPNCEVETRNQRVFIFARRAIRPGEELHYDYGKEYFDDHIRPKGCRCAKCASKR